MYKTAYSTIIKNNLLKKGDKIVVALSGGPDSMALLFFLNEVKPEFAIELYAVHLNHMMRAEASRKDALFVEDVCKRNGIPLYSVCKDVPGFISSEKVSPEEAGRILRREAYAESLAHFSADKIATGHNKNDNAETFLLMLSRGAGTKGLSGIAPESEAGGVRVIRPLINCLREQIEAYCGDMQIPFVTDATNKLPVYTRNKIRLSLIPWLEDNLNSDIVGAITGASEIIREQTEFIELLAKDAYAHCLTEQSDEAISLEISRLGKYGGALKKLIIREAVYRLNGSVKDITRTHIVDVLSLLEKGTGKSVCLPSGIVCKTQYGEIIFGKNTKKPRGFCYRLPLRELVYIEERDIYATFSDEQLNIDNFKNLCTKMMKCDKILSEVYYRTRKPGDKIKLGCGTKKLSDYFIDKKTPKPQREAAAIIADESEVLCILDFCDGELIKNGINKFFIQFWGAENGNNSSSDIRR